MNKVFVCWNSLRFYITIGVNLLVVSITSAQKSQHFASFLDLTLTLALFISLVLSSKYRYFLMCTLSRGWLIDTFAERSLVKFTSQSNRWSFLIFFLHNFHSWNFSFSLFSLKTQQKQLEFNIYRLSYGLTRERHYNITIWIQLRFSFMLFLSNWTLRNRILLEPFKF